MTLRSIDDQSVSALQEVEPQGVSALSNTPPAEPESPFVEVNAQDKRLAQSGKGPLGLLRNLFEPAKRALSEGDPAARTINEVIPDEALDEMYDAVTGPAPRDPFSVKGFNLDNLDTSEDVRAAIDRVGSLTARAVDRQTRGYQGFENTEQLAQQFGKELGDEGVARMLLEREKGGTFNAEQMLAARSLYLRTTEDMVVHAQAIVDGEGGPAAIMKFRHRLALASAMHAQLKGAQTEAARTLSAFRISALGGSPPEAGATAPQNASEAVTGQPAMPGDGIDPAVAAAPDPSGPYIQREIQDLIERTGGEEVAVKAAEAVLDAARSGDMGFVSKVARKVQGKEVIDAVHEGWLAGLVSSPDTWALAFAGNSLVAGVRNAEHWVAGMQRAVLRQDMGGLLEPFMYSYGQVQGVLSGLVLAGRTLALGEAGMSSKYVDGTHQPAIAGSTFSSATMPGANKQTVGETWDAMASRSGFMEPAMLKAAGATGAVVDFSGELLRVPFRVLAAEDQLFRSMAYMGEMQVGAMQHALKNGKDRKHSMQLYQDALSNPEALIPDVHMKSLAQAREDVLQQPGGNDWFSNLNRSINHPVGKWFMKPIFPFMRIINNSMQWSWDRTPLLPEAIDFFRQAGPGNRFNLLMNNADQDFTVKGFLQGSPERDEQIAKMVTGSLLLYGGWQMSQANSFSGVVGESNRKTREGARLIGLQGKSVVFDVDGKTMQYDINRLDPVAMPFLISAMTNEAIALAESDEESNSIVLAGALAMREVLEDKTALAGLNDLMKAIMAPEGTFDDKLISFIAARASSGVPSWMAKFARTGDGERPYYEDTKASNPYDTDTLRFLSELHNKATSRLPRAMAKAAGMEGWDTLPNHVDLFGRPAERQPGFPAQWMSFISAKPTKFSRDQLNSVLPDHLQNTIDLRTIRLNRDVTEEQLGDLIDLVGVDGELQRLNMPVGFRQNKWKGVKLAPHQREYLKRYEGPRLEEALEDTVFSFAYLSAPEVADVDGSKQQMLEAAARDVRRQVDKELTTDLEWSEVERARRIRESVSVEGVAPLDPELGLPETEPGDEITPEGALREFMGGRQQ